MTKTLTIKHVKGKLIVDSEGFCPSEAVKVLGKAINAIQKEYKKDPERDFRKEHKDVYTDAEMDLIEQLVDGCINTKQIETLANIVAADVEHKRKTKGKK